MPKPRKTLAQLEATGTLNKNLGRYMGRIEAKGTVIAPVGSPPRHLLAVERAVWSEVVKNAPEGLLSRPDRIVIEVVSKLVAKTRTGDFKTSDLNAIVSILARLGMTPSDRQRMGVEPPPATTERNPFTELDVLDELDELD